MFFVELNKFRRILADWLTWVLVTDKRNYPTPTRFVLLCLPVLKLRGNARVVVQGEVTGDLKWVASQEMEGRKEVLEVGQLEM